jgi:hypothetical protein
VSELRRIERALKLRIERKKIEYNHLVRQWRCRENNLPSRTLTAMPGDVFTTDIASVPLAWHSVGDILRYSPYGYEDHYFYFSGNEEEVPPK